MMAKPEKARELWVLFLVVTAKIRVICPHNFKFYPNIVSVSEEKKKMESEILYIIPDSRPMPVVT